MTLAPAAARIRSYSLILWAAGVAAIAGVVTLTAFSVTLDLTTRVEEGWTSPTPVSATTLDGGTTWTADESAYIDVPAALGADPLVVTLVGGGPFVTVNMSTPGRTAADGVPPLVAMLFLDEPGVAVATEQGSRLWLTAQPRPDAVAGPWTATLTPLSVTDVTEGVTTGSGDADLRYAGAASSAVIEQTGTGILTVDVVSASGEPYSVSTVDASARTIPWTPGDDVVLRIRSESDTAAWTLTIGDADATE